MILTGAWKRQGKLCWRFWRSLLSIGGRGDLDLWGIAGNAEHAARA